MEFKELFMISHRSLLRGRSDCIAIVRMAKVFSKMGLNVTIVMPHNFLKENVKLKEIWNYYGIKKNTFKIILLPTPLWDNTPPLLKRIVKLIFHSFFALILFIKFIFKKEKTIFYLRGVIECLPYLFLKKIFKEKIYLIHDLYDLGSENPILKKILKEVDLIVSITNSLKEKTIKFANIPDEKIIVFGMGITEDFLQKNQKIISKKEKKDLRKALNLPEEKFIVTYTGKVNVKQKEIILLVETAKKIRDVLFVFVGGRVEPVKTLREKYKNIENVLFKGYSPPSQVHKYQMASDVLVLFYTKDIPTFDVCSPSKLFEYMASGTPIIAVNSKSICEIIKDGENGLIVEAENIDDLIKKINILKENRALAEKLSTKALKDVNNYTFEKRSKAILQKIEELAKSK